MLGYSRLYRRNHSYYIRARVPDSLRFLVKSSEIKYSLHTNNFWEALELLRKESYKIDLRLKLFKDVSMLIKDHKILLDDKDIDKLITFKLKQLEEAFEIHYDDILNKSFDKENIKMFPAGKLEEMMATNSRYTRKDFEIDRTETYFKEYVNEVLADRPHPSIARQAIRIQNEQLSLFDDRSNVSESQAKLLSAMRGVDKYINDKVACMEEDIEFNRGLNPRVRHCLNAVEEERTRRVLAGQKIRTKWQEVYDEMETHKLNARHTTPNHIEQGRKCVDTIFLILGKKYVEELKYTDCHKISDCIYNLPKRWRTVAKQKHLDIKQLLSQTDNTDKISQTNAQKYLRHFKEFIVFARRRRYITQNLDDDIDIHKNRTNTSYDGFTDDELKTIFNPETYPSRFDRRNHHRYWVPLIALYTGMRLNEICQLYVDDVKYFNRVWYFDLKVEREDHHIKNEQSKRFVPVHPKLKEMGFLQYLRSMRNSGEKQLFSRLVYNPKKYFRGAMSHWFNRYLSQVGITDKSKVFHSIRHTVKPHLRDAGIPQEYQNAICGWTSSDIGERVYGGQVAVDILYKELSKLDYPFLNRNLMAIKAKNKI